MNLKILDKPVRADAFIPLAKHQAQTPKSFFAGLPVLHYYALQSKIAIPTSHLKLFPLFHKEDLSPSPHLIIKNDDVEDEPEELKEVLIEHVDVWINSEYLTLFNKSIGRGVSIPYPSISLHAIRTLRIPKSPNGSHEKQGIYLHIPRYGYDEESSDEEHEGPRLIEITIIPNPILDHGTMTTVGTSPALAGHTHTQTMFMALTACADLHPDPNRGPTIPGFASPARSDPITFAGSIGYDSVIVPQTAAEMLLSGPASSAQGGWVTADNVDEYMAEVTRQRSLRAGKPLSALEQLDIAINKQRADEAEAADAKRLADEDEPVSSAGAASESNKWRRTE